MAELAQVAESITDKLSKERPINEEVTVLGTSRIPTRQFVGGTKLPRVFVYGTLKKGFRLHDSLGPDAKFLGEFWLPGYTMRAVGTAFPAIHLEPNVQGSRVFGEVYEISPQALRRCDWIEGVPNHYFRREVMLLDVGWVYTYCYPQPAMGDEFDRVVSGKWEKDKNDTVHVKVPSYQPPPWNSNLPVVAAYLPPPPKPGVDPGELLWKSKMDGEQAEEAT
jgi:gamma-glutamylaminecyclotransferase